LSSSREPPWNAKPEPARLKKSVVPRPESLGLAQPARDLVLIPAPSQLLTPCFEPTSLLCLGSEQEENMRRAESEYGRSVEPSPHLLYEPWDIELSVFLGKC
jgi:hypothetical protein